MKANYSKYEAGDSTNGVADPNDHNNNMELITEAIVWTVIVMLIIF